MKIACLGNMNNIMSPTAQYLAEKGHEVDLFLLHEYDHFAPSADYEDESDIKFSIKNLNMDFGKVMDIPLKTIKEKLEGYDFYIGIDYAPAILARINKRLDIFTWAGTDLFDWPFYKSAFRIPQLWEGDKIMTAVLQFEGIKNARMIPMSLNNDFIIEAIKKIGFQGEIINPLPFLYYPEFENNRTVNSEWVNKMKKIKESSDLVLFQQSRQWWKTAPKAISKGNDVFFRGFADFVKKHSQLKVKAVLLEYGSDVEESKKLIQELGIQENIVWFPTLLRRELLSVLSFADIGIGQFDNDGAYLYCSNAEIIASKVTYLAYRNDIFNKKHNCELYPMLNANSPEEVAQQLEFFVSNRNKVELETKKAFEWLMEYNYTKTMEQIEAAIHNNQQNKSLRFLSNFRIKITKIKIDFWAILNKLVLSTKNNFLKQSILEWKK